MTNEEKIEEFVRYAGMTDEERAAVIDTGLFNSFISAYMTLTLREFFGDAEDERIARAEKILKEIMDDTSALEARAMTARQPQ